MIPQQTIQTILDTAQITDVVSDFVALKKRGVNYVACCPFHNEKTPSFYVSPTKGIYKCFGCGKAGSAVNFIMEHEHCSYTDALKYLATKYNIEVVEEELSAEETMRRQRSESLLLVTEFAQKFFEQNLGSSEGKDFGKAYYKSRALEDETIAKFGLGWAPSAKDGLLQAARSAGYKDEYLLEAGLVTQREDGTLADKFRERAMFPIHSLSGRVIAFSGRTLRNDNPAKYLNSPDTPIYTKSNILFGIYFAKSEIAKKDKCIVVEGNVDLVMLHQIGICNVVAPCGTAFTLQQIRLIRKFTQNITLMFDGDSAGIHAALRAIDLILPEGLNVSIVRLPQGEDPDSFARKHTLEEYQNYITTSEQDFLSFKAELLLSDAGNDPLKKANIINDIADSIALIPDAVKRSVFVGSAAGMFEVESDVIFERVKNTRKKVKEDRLKEQERQNRTAATAPAPDYEPVDFVPAEPADPEIQGASEQEYMPENKILAPVEEEILGFLLTNGTDILEFPESEQQSVDFNSEQFTVTEYISDFLDYHNFTLCNVAYAELYEAYLQLYDSGYTQEDIVKNLLNSPNRTISGLTARFSIQKYALTIKDLSDSLTTTASWLSTYVPRTMYTYILKRGQKEIKDLRKSLPKLSGEETIAVLDKIKALMEEGERLKKKIREHE